jgi:arylsulfatase A-like enzyme
VQHAKEAALGSRPAKRFFDEKGQLAWSPDSDKWELYNLEEDWAQANDLANKMPDKLAEMKDLFTYGVRQETKAFLSAAAFLSGRKPAGSATQARDDVLKGQEVSSNAHCSGRRAA